MGEANHNHRIRHRFRVIVSLLAILCILISLLLLAAGFYITVYLSSNYDDSIDVLLFGAAARRGATKIYYYNFSDRQRRVGELVELVGEKLHSPGNCIYVSYDAVPDNLKRAFIAIEDKRFGKHSGVDWLRTMKAAVNYIFGADSSFGGSTITQQVIKNITGKNDVSPQRKIQEIIWALDLETKLDKTEILELYMNIVNLSHGCVGVQAAANTYFSKDVSQLTLIECAAIAAITNNPYHYDPARFPEKNKARRDIILVEMYEQGYISEEEFSAAYGAELALDLSWYESFDGVNSWYVDMVVEDVIADLCAEYGYSREAASLMLYSGGLRIYTAMDPEVQSLLEEYYGNAGNFPDIPGENPFESAMIIIDPYTGDILGVAGALGGKTANRVQNYATTTRRPSGSTIKPLSVYAPALEAGIITSATVYDDVPVTFKNTGGGLSPWPKNYPPAYHGLTNIIRAIQESVNTVAVRVLMDLGERESFDFLVNKAGMSSLVERQTLSDGTQVSDIGLASLALGQQNFGVTVRELTAAYSMFVNNGVFSPPRSYIKVTDSAGNLLLANDYYNSGVRAISEETASIMTLMLQNVVSRGTAKAITLDEYVEVAGKTGTTQDNCDKWFVGYTPYFIGGVWCGHEYPQPLSGVPNNICFVIWDEIMTRLHERYVTSGEKPAGFNISPKIVGARCCADSGKLMTAACRTDPRGDRGVMCWFVSGEEPEERCDRHITVDYDIIGGGVACPLCPAENLIKVGMIKVERSFPTQVYVTDAQYVWRRLPAYVEPALHINQPFFYNLLKPNEYCGISNTTSQFNRYCALHGAKPPPGVTADTTITPETSRPWFSWPLWPPE
ncbi:MAG TPA: glycosyl transferase [Clostridiales bacterium]|jgi:penicillin-binding protein 1A|nr:glycosyl transferase [Clostridiales bacterium]